VTFEQGLAETIDWYLNNEDWLANINNESYRTYTTLMI
jgi:dTDP-glucose 4,6-dehydratase